MGAAAAPRSDRLRLHGSRVGQAQSWVDGVRETAGTDRCAAAGGDGLGVHPHRGTRRPGDPRRRVRRCREHPLIVMMLVAMFTVHLRYGFSAINTIGLTADGPQFGPPGYEVNLLYIAGL